MSSFWDQICSYRWWDLYNSFELVFMIPVSGTPSPSSITKGPFSKCKSAMSFTCLKHSEFLLHNKTMIPKHFLWYINRKRVSFLLESNVTFMWISNFPSENLMGLRLPLWRNLEERTNCRVLAFHVLVLSTRYLTPLVPKEGVSSLWSWSLYPSLLPVCWKILFALQNSTLSDQLRNFPVPPLLSREIPGSFLCDL